MATPDLCAVGTVFEAQPRHDQQTQKKGPDGNAGPFLILRSGMRMPVGIMAGPAETTTGSTARALSS